MYGRVRFNRYNQMLGSGTRAQKVDSWIWPMAAKILDMPRNPVTQLFWMSCCPNGFTDIKGLFITLRNIGHEAAVVQILPGKGQAAVLPEDTADSSSLAMQLSYFAICIVDFWHAFLFHLASKHFTDNLRPILPRTNLGKETVVQFYKLRWARQIPDPLFKFCVVSGRCACCSIW